MFSKLAKTSLAFILCLTVFIPVFIVFSHENGTNGDFDISSISEAEIDELVFEEIATLENRSSNWNPSMPLPNQTLTAAELAAWKSHYCETGDISDIEREILNLVNAERVNRNIHPLEINYDLFRAARFKSQNMNDLDYFSHHNPIYGAPWDMTSLFSDATFSGENLAWHSHPSAQAFMNAWMNSPAHRDNLLNPNHRTIGIGVFNRMATQTFSSSVGTGTSCAFIQPETPTSAPYQITSMRRPGVTIRSATFRTGPSSSYPTIGTISGSTDVRITGRTGSWYRVVVNDTTGWLRQNAVSYTRVNAVVTTNNAHVRAGRSSSHESLTRVQRGQRVTITRRATSWSRVTVNGHTGWIRNRDLSIEDGARPGRTIVDHVAVHSRPNAGSSVRHLLPRHSQLMIVQRTTDGWSQIRLRHNNGTLRGWVRTEQIENRNQTRQVTRDGGAALRSGPASGYNRLRTVPRNANVSVRARVGSWYHVRVTVNGHPHDGWMRRGDLTILRLP